MFLHRLTFLLSHQKSGTGHGLRLRERDFSLFRQGFSWFIVIAFDRNARAFSWLYLCDFVHMSVKLADIGSFSNGDFGTHQGQGDWCSAIDKGGWQRSRRWVARKLTIEKFLSLPRNWSSIHLNTSNRGLDQTRVLSSCKMIYPKRPLTKQEDDSWKCSHNIKTGFASKGGTLFLKLELLLSLPVSSIFQALHQKLSSRLVNTALLLIRTVSQVSLNRKLELIFLLPSMK